MGVVWEIFVASTSGLGEAGAIRISYYLAENQPKQAKRLSHKVIFLAAIQAFGVGSIFILLGPNIAFVLTPYSVLQNMLSDLVGITALANFSMTFAQIYWALVGAQGRFGLASLCIILSRFIVIYPMAAICVFRYLFDTPSVAGSIAVGYATAAFALALIIMQSDWKQLALEAQEQLMPNDAEAAGLGLGESSDDEEMSDDSDDDEIL